MALSATTVEASLRVAPPLLLDVIVAKSALAIEPFGDGGRLRRGTRGGVRRSICKSASSSFSVRRAIRSSRGSVYIEGGGVAPRLCKGM